MSTGCECAFFNVKDRGWFYLLEHGSAPKNSWDWREYATCYGPFSSFDRAYKHLHDHHANPGGFSQDDEPVEYDKLDEVDRQHVDEAPKNTRELARHAVPGIPWLRFS